MTPREYCADKVAQPGSTLYYSVLYVPPENRHAICSLYAFRHEQLALCLAGNHGNIEQTKLAWWHEEVERLGKGSPRHPVTRALEESVSASTLPILSGMLADLAAAMPVSDRERQTELAARSGSTIALAVARHCGYENDSNTERIHDLGLGSALAEVFMTRGAPDRHSLDHAIEVLENTTGAIEQPDRYPLLSGLTMGAIDLAFLRRLKRGQPRAAPRDLTPLAKFWIAWKTERAERKAWRNHKP